MPNLKTLHQRYHEKGLEVIGVSLDTNLETLRTFVREQGLAWVHICDGAAFESPLVRRYNVQGIPATFLIDGNGRILATGLRGPLLEQTVQTALREP